MSYSSTYTDTSTQTFTRTHARHLAAKVATDLKRIQRLYKGGPSDREIAEYEAEVIEFLKAGYLGTVMYGFRRNGDWVEPTFIYTALDLAGIPANDDPGRVRPGADTSGALFYSYLTYSRLWERLQATRKESFRKRLPFRRIDAPEPGVDGNLNVDRVYSAGGRALERETVRSWR